MIAEKKLWMQKGAVEATQNAELTGCGRVIVSCVRVLLQHLYQCTTKRCVSTAAAMTSSYQEASWRGTSATDSTLDACTASGPSTDLRAELTLLSSTPSNSTHQRAKPHVEAMIGPTYATTSTPASVLFRFTIALSALLRWLAAEPDPRRLGGESFLRLSTT